MKHMATLLDAPAPQVPYSEIAIPRRVARDESPGSIRQHPMTHCETLLVPLILRAFRRYPLHALWPARWPSPEGDSRWTLDGSQSGRPRVPGISKDCAYGRIEKKGSDAFGR